MNQKQVEDFARAIYIAFRSEFALPAAVIPGDGPWERIAQSVATAMANQVFTAPATEREKKWPDDYCDCDWRRGEVCKCKPADMQDEGEIAA